MKTIKLADKIIYQIFPRSFYDSNNDGDGDLVGITRKLAYLKKLGINAIWLCPIYQTEFVDAGYDVLDYQSVWKQFGTLDQFKQLTKKANAMGIDIIMDIVLNHVSNQHHWFKKACQSRDHVEYNYFIWRDQLSEQEKQINSIFGGSAWEYVDSVKAYYFHLFAKEQVDLNWNHPETIKALAKVIDFWYSLGVKGFRLDAIKHVIKNFKEVEHNQYFAWCEGSVKALKAFEELAFKDKPDAYTLGEASGIRADELLRYGDGKDKVADNYFNFSWWWIGWSKKTGRNGYDPNWDLKEFVWQQKPFQENEKIRPEMFTNFLSNHDTSRSISRWGDEGLLRIQSAKTQALLLMTLKGVPCIYYGEEIGLLNTHFSSRKEFVDIDIHNGFRELVDQKKVYSESEMILYCNINSRDAGRSLMQWNARTNGGFNRGHKPWIKQGRNHKTINVNQALKDRNSIFYFYQKLIDLRKNKLRDLLVLGSSSININEQNLITVRRTYQDQAITALINFSNKELKINPIKGKQLLSTYEDNKVVKTTLRPFESVLIKE
ncbi:alpha-amylase family glycosyl hydrolase [Mycoplasmoides gallisepticum]|uniref:alpha-amylase family glycosyl hydrolase n=1 Tax=Mycoplasmoides gallisepticum TaxID=2096 RepID=UPI000314640A|nr:alpha-amylase family glycosyl hydrolase [Mycoplasmoides gallisepticum]